MSLAENMFLLDFEHLMFVTMIPLAGFRIMLFIACPGIPVITFISSQ